MNPILLCDGYKLDHRRQYPKGTTKVYSNWTPRSSRVEGQNSVVFFGLQYFLARYLNEEFRHGFFERPLAEVVEKYQRRIDNYLGPNEIGTDHIAALHALGCIPLEFKALPEGCLVPLRVPMFTVENTLPEFYWLVNYIESLLSCVLWLPCTSATTAYRYRKMLDAYARETGGDPAFVPWQGHDFSFRGMAGPEASALSGAAHLLFFSGTDTIPAIDLVEEYYGPVVAGSVPATEHSVMSAGGMEGELETFNRLLDLYPTGILSVVSDTWDLWHVLTEILPQIKSRVMERNGKLVIRPDSGDPVKIICGDPSSEGPARRGVVGLLWDLFSGTTTAEGFKQLDPHIGVIYGDSITEERCRAICEGLKANGFASTNMVFGIGSYTYQYVTRDTYGFAMKATWAEVDGIGRDLYKAPKTDSGEKFSAKGRLSVVTQDGVLRLCAERDDSLLIPVWRNGKFVMRYTFEQVTSAAHHWRTI